MEKWAIGNVTLAFLSIHHLALPHPALHLSWVSRNSQMQYVAWGCATWEHAVSFAWKSPLPPMPRALLMYFYYSRKGLPSWKNTSKFRWLSSLCLNRNLWLTVTPFSFNHSTVRSLKTEFTYFNFVPILNCSAILVK